VPNFPGFIASTSVLACAAADYTISPGLDKPEVVIDVATEN
jgi:hypothetical protein